ncbi:hypothetical protein [Ekhidna sp.]|uniref:hypothetical protein n=1 Tax=Ekhidna sp. TaxID=2608089 RepID=UPI003CCBA515
MIRWRAMLFTTVIGYASIQAFCQNGTANYHQVTITASAITIHGETNLNKFKCSMDQLALNDSIRVKNIWLNEKLEFEGLRLKYPVDQFDCGLRAMNSDFQELLKSDEEPHLFLQLNSITLHPGNDAFEELNVDAEVEVFIAGVQKQVEISGGKVINHSSAELTLKGKKQLLMTHFNIEPPSKMFGMIQVTDDIIIEFEIGMKVSPL